MLIIPCEHTSVNGNLFDNYRVLWYHNNQTKGGFCMYEDKSVPFHINWKSLLIKLGILLVVVFVVIFLISLFTKDEAKKSNFGTNLSAMRDAATEYFVGSRLPKDVNEAKSITLEEMFEKNLLVEFLDEDGNSCNTTDSYAEVTKLDEENYRLEVTLVCENDSDTIVNTIKRAVQDTDKEDEETNEVDTPQIDEPSEEDNVDTDKDNSSNNPNKNNGTTTNKPTHNTNQNTNVHQNTNVNTNTNVNNNTNTSHNSNTNNNNNINHIVTNTCGYGKKDYVTLYPLAYVVDGNCAVASLYTYANKANDVYISEYQKLVQEMYQLNPDIIVKTHDGSDSYITPIKNTAGTGYVGYQMFFKAVIKNTYSEKTVYAYYLDLNGSRKVIVDNRNNI